MLPQMRITVRTLHLLTGIFTLCLGACGGSNSTDAPTAGPASGSATLSWTRPVQNTDGTPLLDLTGYKVYYGTNSSNLTSSVTISDPNTTSATISGLATGTTYYFAIASLSASGGEGNKSNAASKTM